MPTIFCGFPTCENEAELDGNGEVKTVLVSEDVNTVKTRPACYSCDEVYTTGCQYARLRAVRRLLKAADDLSADGAHTEANCCRLAAALIDSVDDHLEDSATPEDG